ncbi:MAG: TetR/AcrR family transcriptional regulator [Balneolaceae bacterium]|jgi:AcrR family transcriptional regulator
MEKQSKDTRSEIIEAARSEYFSNGYKGARLQNIADHIGVTKAMIHYYFNTKKELFEQVFRQSVEEVFGDLGPVLEADMPLFKKIEQLVVHCLQKAEAFPHALAFVITESRRQPGWLQPIFEKEVRLNLESFNQELEQAASNYEIASVTAAALLLNIFSLCYYPVVAAPVNHSLGLSGAAQNSLNKGLVLDTILNWLTA